MRRLLFILSLLITASVNAQITDTAIIASTGYSFNCPACGIYPKVYQQKTADISRAGWKNVDTYGAKGNGTTVDDAAISSAFAAAKSSGTGVIFTSGKTYLVSKKLNITIGNTDTIRVWAYGSTIKQADLTGGTFIEISHASGSKGGGVLWFGGTIDGNQFNQRWPYNPHGGSYDTRQFANDKDNNEGFDEAHSCMLAATRAGLAIFKDITLINILLDGIRVEECKVAIVADGTARNGAPVHYNTETRYSTSPGVGEQGTYWKFRTTPSGDQEAYFLNLDGDGGSITIQFSYPDPRDGTTTMPHNTIGVIANCRSWNAAQDGIHIEDCYKNYIYNTIIGADAVGNYIPRVWVSNRTGIASFKKCTIINSWINFVSAVNLQLGFVDECTFTSQYTSGNDKCDYFVNNGSHVANNVFTGRASQAQVTATEYSQNNRYINFNARALTNVLVSDNDYFQNGSNPVTFANNGKIYRSTSNGVTGMPVNSTFTSSVLNPFLSKMYFKNQNNQFVGTIQLGQ